MKLLIIEDEPIEREALKLMVDNNSNGRFETMTAENGFQALAVMNEWQPDIAMVDINMPGMNGLDTIRAMKKKNPGLRFLIMSSYNRFEYAQEALKLGVEDFILKPAKITQLLESLNVIANKLVTDKQENQAQSMLRNRIEEIRPVVESDCIYELIGGRSAQDVRSNMEFLGYRVKSGFCFVTEHKERPRFILHRVKEALKSVGMECIGEQFHNILVFFVISEKDIQERKMHEVGNFTAMLLNEIGLEGTRIGVGQIQTELEKFSVSYQQALSALKEGTQNNQALTIYHLEKEKQEIPKEELNLWADRLVDAIRKVDEKQVNDELNSIYTELIMKAEDISYARDCIYQFLLLLMERMRRKDASIEIPLSMEEIFGMESRKELELYVTLKVNVMMSQVLSHKKNNGNQLILQATAYIEIHYAENLTLEDLATNLDVSSFYLSKLFKKITGKNFTEVLAEKRVEKAKELLRGQMSIKEVTFKVGFNSQNYFTKIFKKYCGLTPKEYRQSLNQNSLPFIP